MTELSIAERILLAHHKPTAQRFIDAWHAAWLNDLKSRQEEYKAACQRDSAATALWALIEKFFNAETDEEATALDAEIEIYMRRFPHAYDPIGNEWEKADSIPPEDLATAYKCLWGDP